MADSKWNAYTSGIVCSTGVQHRHIHRYDSHCIARTALKMTCYVTASTKCCRRLAAAGIVIGEPSSGALAAFSNRNGLHGLAIFCRKCSEIWAVFFAIRQLRQVVLHRLSSMFLSNINLKKNAKISPNSREIGESSASLSAMLCNAARSQHVTLRTNRVRRNAYQPASFLANFINLAHV